LRESDPGGGGSPAATVRLPLPLFTKPKKQESAQPTRPITPRIAEQQNTFRRLYRESRINEGPTLTPSLRATYCTISFEKTGTTGSIASRGWPFFKTIQLLGRPANRPLLPIARSYPITTTPPRTP